MLGMNIQVMGDLQYLIKYLTLAMCTKRGLWPWFQKRSRDYRGRLADLQRWGEGGSCKSEPSHLGSLQPFHATSWPSLYVPEHCGYEVNPWECLDTSLAPTSPKVKNACCQHLSLYQRSRPLVNLPAWCSLPQTWKVWFTLFLILVTSRNRCT